MINHLDNQNFEDAFVLVDKITSNKIEIEPQYFKIQLVDAYVHIADSMTDSKESIPKAEKVILGISTDARQRLYIISTRTFAPLMYYSYLAKKTWYSCGALATKWSRIDRI